MLRTASVQGLVSPGVFIHKISCFLQMLSKTTQTRYFYIPQTPRRCNPTGIANDCIGSHFCATQVAGPL